MEDKYIRAKKILERYNQTHLLTHFEKLNNEKKEYLLNQILNINFEELNKLFEQTKIKINFSKDKIEPIIYIEKEKLKDEDRERYFRIGQAEIKNAKLAVVTMAGGQGTRLRTQWAKRNIYIKCKANS